MMGTGTHMLLSGIARTTLCTTLAAAATWWLLSALKIRSPRIHRLAWVLVILQGWILLPLSFTVSVPNNMPTEALSGISVVHTEQSVAISSPASPQASTASHWPAYAHQAVVAAWLLGTVAVFGLYVKQYHGLIALVPIGTAPEAESWSREWRELKNATAPRANVHFRVTSGIGPLLCFVPFVYLVLVPRLLWARLSRDDRMAILRHELAHLRNGDLCKNLAVRLLALPQWFNPLVWLAVRRYEEAGEWACDEEVLAASDLAGTRYADTLLRVAGFTSSAPCGAVAASGGKLTRRVTRLVSSSNKEVSKMKNLTVPCLLLVVALGQAIRIESTPAEEPVAEAAVATRAETVAKWRAEPYRIEPPDVLDVDLALDDFNAEVEPGTRVAADKLHVQGRFIVAPDGTVELKGFGRHQVGGLTTDEAQQAIVNHLTEKFGVPRVKIDVAQVNSKVVYVVQKRPGGDSVTRLPCTKETNVVQVLAAVADEVEYGDQVYLESPSADSQRPATRLAVDLQALVKHGDLATNYDLLPGDRLLVMLDGATEGDLVPPTAPPAPPRKSKLPDMGQPTATPKLPPSPNAYYAPATPAKAIRKPKPVKLSFQVIVDAKDNFSEVDGLGEGDAMISDSRSVQGLVRVLLKNELARVLMTPSLTMTTDRSAIVSVTMDAEPMLERLDLEVTPSIHSQGVLMDASVSMTRGGKTSEHNFGVYLKEGESYVMRLSPGKTPTPDSPHTYLVMTRDNLK